MNRPLGATACITVAVAAAAAAGAILPLAGEAHAQQEDEEVPAWVKRVFGFYVDG